jgi:hypothetical protein
MKKRFFAAVFAMLIIASFAYVPEVRGGGNMACADLSGCRGSASCGGKGTQSGCTITCEDGAVIICPEVSKE